MESNFQALEEIIEIHLLAFIANHFLVFMPLTQTPIASLPKKN